VLTICGVGSDLFEARKRAYKGVAAVDWPEGFNRSDIGAKGVARLKA
jgi:phosphoribosylamine--glycine ligase